MSKPANDQQAESIRHRLRNLLRKRNEDMQFGLQRYAIERFLYRLGVSSHRDRFVLKGASLFALWGGSVYRPTRDLDFTGYGIADEADVLAALREICMLSPVDELIFDPDTLNAEPIRDDSEYSGLRIRLAARLGTSRIPIQIDIGFGNAIEPSPQYADYPTLLDDPKPRIRTYPPEAVIAEKLHAMVVLGERNSRYKDFYDLYVLARQFRFDGKTLARAIAATFERRQTPITAAIPTSLTPRFFADEARAQQWRAYMTRNALPAAPADFDSVGELIRQFLGPAWTALAENITFASKWPPAGPWNSENSEKEISTAMPASSGLSSYGQRHSQNSDTARIEDIEIPIAIPLRRFKPYPAYKDSGVEWLGPIPARWNLKRLKRVVEFQGGGTPAKENVEYWQGEIPWVSPKDMKVLVVLDTEDKITAEAIRESATRLVPAGAVLIVVRSGILVHSIPVALAGCEVTLNQDLKAMIPDSELVPQYLMYLISGMQRELLVEWKKEGATVESLELELVANTPTPLPSVTEQRVIAAFLDRETGKIDALVAKKERLIELLQEKRAALITRAVTKGLNPNVPMKDSGVEWLGQIPEHWKVERLKQVFINLDSRRRPLSGEERSALAKVYPYYGASGIIDQVEDYLFDEPLILVAEDGANLFSRSTPLAFVATGKYWVNNHAHILKPHDGMVSYWSHVLATIVYDPWISGSAQPKLTSENLGSIPLPLPPLTERKEILAFLQEHAAKFDVLMGTVRDGIDRVKELRTALISAAVTGKVDVREEAA